MERHTTLETLTPRQREVLRLIARGRTNAQIGDELGISLDGAKWHVSELLGRLGVETREEAADLWRAEQGLRPRLARFARAAAIVGGWRVAAGVAAGLAVVAGAVAVILAISIGDEGSEPAVPVESPTPASPSPMPTPTATVAPRLTGRPDVDAIIDLVLAKDLPGVVALFDAQPEPCSVLPPQGVGSPPQCPTGVPDGADVLTVRASSCERWDVTALLDLRFASDRVLYTAFEPAPGEQYGPYPSGEVALVFAADDDQYERFDVRDGRIAGMWAGCGGGFNTLRDMIDDAAGPVLVAPAYPIPTPTPTPAPDASGYPQGWTTAIGDLDIAVQALVSGNRDRIRSHLALQPYDCADARPGEEVSFCATRTYGEIFPAFICPASGFGSEGVLLAVAELGAVLDRISDPSNRIYAANVNLPPTDDQRFRSRSAAYVAAFNVPARDDAFVAFIEDGMVISLDLPCPPVSVAGLAAALPRAGVDAVILPPPVTTPSSPRQP